MLINRPVPAPMDRAIYHSHMEESSFLSYSEMSFIMSNPVRRGGFRAPCVRGQQSVNDILRMLGKWFLKSRRAAPRGDRESDRGRPWLVKLPRLNGAGKKLREKYVRGGLADEGSCRNKVA